MMRRGPLSRRTLLRGIGTAVALPFLDAMGPAFAAAPNRLAGKAPVRLAFSYVPNVSPLLTNVHMELNDPIFIAGSSAYPDPTSVGESSH